MNTTEIRLPLRIGQARRTLATRARDVYTVAEIFHERRYQLARPLGPAPVIVDAGANVGVASAWFLLAHPDARLIAIEPVSQNVHWLAQNLGNESRATVVRAALGEIEGEVLMSLSAHSAEHAIGDLLTCRVSDPHSDASGSLPTHRAP
jgi:hypothetical protein